MVRWPSDRAVIGLDTNVLVRYIMQDDAKQSPLATRLVEPLSAESPGFVPLVSVVELGWVLSSAYELECAQLVAAFEGLLRTKEMSSIALRRCGRRCVSFKAATLTLPIA